MTNPFTVILEKNQLTCRNYVDWLRNVKIVLNSEDIDYVLEAHMPALPAEDALTEEHTIYKKWVADEKKVRSYLMASMSNAIQVLHESMQDSREILLHLRELYGETSRNARFQLTAELYGTKMAEGSSVNDHVLKNINAIERLLLLASLRMLN
ncbi:UBN2_3 domain-containing protein [Cephalotus follicularis]|uniref:UBN2_3 domain-containing protein n=1 Tax=Cephalotus follicularis TaxID=3775 RepID=A0A1Q3C286_CEPFO|nr:UBN2_3 domain-containing protein [Cephalotus follicularis]